MNFYIYFDRTKFLRDGLPTTVTVVKELAEWQDDDGRCFLSDDIEKAKECGWTCTGIVLRTLEFPDLALELDDDEYRYFEYVGPILRLYPSKTDLTGVEVF